MRERGRPPPGRCSEHRRRPAGTPVGAEGLVFPFARGLVAQGQLAGGLYGVAIGGAFFGESMFHHVRDASKVALLALVERLRKRRFTLLDTQWLTPHLQTFGAIEIPRTKYLQILNNAVNLRRQFID